MTDSQSRILVVDDVAEVRKMIRIALETAGYPVDVAVEGQDAFRKARSGEFNLVLMDLAMPGWNGWEAIESLEIVSPDTRVVVVSAFIDEQGIDRLKSFANFRGVVHKPFRIEELLARVADALRG